MLLLSLSACNPVTTATPLDSTPSQSIAASPAEIVRSTSTIPPQIAPIASLTPNPAPHPILGDVRVRQAIAFCTDRAGLIRSVYPWLNDPAPFEADSFLPPGHWAYIGDDADFTRYPFSPEQGMALLDEAGWRLASGATDRTNADGKELLLTLTTTDAKFRQTWAAVWEGQMRTCGIHIIRNHTPAAWFFGETTGLSQRDFEIAAFTWVANYDFGGLATNALYACNQIPSAANNWRGQNYSGWCNPAADAAIRDMTSSLDKDEQRADLRTVQREYARDLPGLPLFFRASVFLINPALENFVATDDGIHTWNAAEWRIPGRDTIVIGESAEPASPLWFENAYVAEVIKALINGSNYVRRNYAYQPVLLKKLPGFENGGATENDVLVKDDDLVIDWSGKAVVAMPGVVVLDWRGQKVLYNGGEITMRQLLVTYEFVDGLTWSDGVPVSRADYELAYRAMCDPAIRGSGPFSPTFPDPSPACDLIAGVDFLGDNAYRVKWKPGFSGANLEGGDRPYFLPPFSRLPAHMLLDDGRKLADVPPGQWSSFDAVKRKPLGAGPYVLKEWVYGQSMTLEANPNFYQGPPATPRIIVKFLEHDQVIPALLNGEVDVVDWETLRPEDVEDFQLMQAQEAGKVRVIAMPSSTWEQLDFLLTLP